MVGLKADQQYIYAKPIVSILIFVRSSSQIRLYAAIEYPVCFIPFACIGCDMVIIRLHRNGMNMVMKVSSATYNF